MFTKILARLVFAASLMVGAVAWAASPTVDQVYQAAKAGDYAQAESMMNQVLSEHPDSAKAHFIQAELLAKQGKVSAARGELNTAQRLDPKLSFAKPEAVQALQAQLTNTGRLVRGNGSVQVRPIHSESPISWKTIALLVGVFLAVMAFLRSRKRWAGDYRSAGTLMPGGGPASYGPGGTVMTPPQAGGGMGSGILGGLATGAAMGAGMMAGQALMHKMFDGTQGNPLSSANDLPPQDGGGNTAYDMGGQDFGVNAGSWDSGDGGGSWDDGGGSDGGWN